METTEIQERNKQIALMLGYINTTPTDKDFNIFENKEKPFSAIPKMIETRSMEFHSDWNWLMEAVEFIQSLRLDIPEYNVVDYYIVTSSSTFCNIISGLNHADGETKSPFFYNKSSVGKNQKEAAFLAVSDFAKLYNEKKL